MQRREAPWHPARRRLGRHEARHLVPPREGLVWVAPRVPGLLAPAARLRLAVRGLRRSSSSSLLARAAASASDPARRCAPAGSLLFMIASRLSAAGERPVPGAFVELASAERPRLVAPAQARHRLSGRGLPRDRPDRRWSRATRWPPSSTRPATRRRRPKPTATQLADPRLQAGLLLRLALGRAAVDPVLARAGASSTGAARAGPRRSSSAPSRSGATRARSRVYGLGLARPRARAAPCCSALVVGLIGPHAGHLHRDAADPALHDRALRQPLVHLRRLLRR